MILTFILLAFAWSPFWDAELIDEEAASVLLPTAITINSIEVEAQAVYQGADATTANWAATTGDDMSVTGSGHVVAEETFFSQTELVASAAGTGTWAAEGSSFDIGTGDFVLEMIVKGSTNTAYYAANFVGGAHGWALYRSALNSIRLYSTDGTVRQSDIGTLTDGAWGHILIISDRDVGMRLYVNGALAGGNATTTTGALGTGDAAAILGDASGGTISNGSVAWVAIWESAAWLDTSDQAAFAAARYGLL